MAVRDFLRQAYPSSAPGRGGVWELTDEQLTAVRARFSLGTSGVMGTVSPGEVPRSPYQQLWYWEGNVQEAVRQRLICDGWTVSRFADAGRKEHGDDLVAVRATAMLVIEVKGYPPSTYADPRRSGEFKRTNPTLQAKHWLAEALLRSMRTLERVPQPQVAVGLPDFPRYRGLVGELEWSLAQLSLTILWVTEAEVRAAVAGVT